MAGSWLEEEIALLCVCFDTVSASDCGGMKSHKRSAEPDPSTNGKKSKVGEEDGKEVSSKPLPPPGRNPMRVRFDDLTTAELGRLISIVDSRVVLEHPRVNEHPYHGSLIAYLTGQVVAIQENTVRNLYQSDRFTGLTNLLVNLTSLFNCDQKGLEQLPHLLHSDEELNRRMVTMVVEYFLKEIPDENDGSNASGNGEAVVDQNALEQRLASNLGNLLVVIHNYVSFEARLSSDQRHFMKARAMNLYCLILCACCKILACAAVANIFLVGPLLCAQSMFKCPALKTFVGRSLDLIDLPISATPSAKVSLARGVRQ